MAWHLFFFTDPLQKNDPLWRCRERPSLPPPSFVAPAGTMRHHPFVVFLE